VSSIAISLIVFACVFGGALCGLILQRRASSAIDLSADSKDVVKMSMGLVATMAALVLGLLISSAKSFYEAQNSELTQMAARIVLLDRMLAHYGPETKEVRDSLRSTVAASIDRVWPQDRSLTSRSELVAPSMGAETLLVGIQGLSPKDDRQRALLSQALNMAIELDQTRWLMYEQGAGSVSGPMLAILVFWLATIFLSFGLFAPRNATVITALFVAGLSVSGAIFLILEMYAPFGGIIKISSAPLRVALTHLGQ
jgi:Protein of unknown function (DUF4239)